MSEADFPQSITRAVALETALKYLTGMTELMTVEEVTAAAQLAQTWIALADSLRKPSVAPKTPRERVVPWGPIEVRIIESELLHQKHGDDLGIYASGVAKGRELAARALLHKLQEPVGYGHHVDWDSETVGAPQWLIELVVQTAVDG